MPPKVVLLFEDNRLYRELMTEILTEQDFQVTAFADPVRYVASENRCDHCGGNVCADALITDNQMPGMSGLELIQWITDSGCKLPKHRRAVISGSWSSEEYDQAQQLGCKIFQKPASVDEIYQWLDAGQ
ncbi:response regulator [Pelovirga terrestris]|uniref:Response regulator n=1 Tax=Pelovirga terrestris TaxID=2771352 RepID=A0A8J6QTG0_9BACT|nr:response regulator [Pelovirga terrestris]MBD1401755.1 response regulator [Pelovirga terrestris]